MAEIRARILSLNCRRSSYLADRLIPSRYWPNRRDYLLKAIQTASASIIGLQEATVEQVHWITAKLGVQFNYYGGDQIGNLPVVWDNSKWDPIDAFEVQLPSESGRMMTAVRLASRPPKNPGSIWIVDLHLTVGSTASAIKARHQEIRGAIRKLQTLPGSEHSLICGDFNSDENRTVEDNGDIRIDPGGVRTIAAELGYKSLRTILPPDKFNGDTYSTHNGWKRTPQDGRFIDDILSPTEVQPYSAFLEFTCLRRYPKCGSDHDGVRASFKWNERALP